MFHLACCFPTLPSPADPSNKHAEVWTPQANDQPYSGGFHTFAVDWTADTITSEWGAALGGCDLSGPCRASRAGAGGKSRETSLSLAR